MPSVFKTLVSISVWILFVAGCVAIIMGIVNRDGIRGSSGFAYGTFSIMLSVIAVWFRKKLED